MLHDSIGLIKGHITVDSEFHFTPISPDTLHKYIRGINSNKAIGHDGLSIKFIKLFNPDNLRSLCNIFNECIYFSRFPTLMKLSEISPIFKKNDSLFKENYRSVNILTSLSKVFERILADQFLEFFENILSPFLSAYRKGYSCQHVLLQLTEFWRKALDQGEAVGTIAMDLSKAFDSMPHGLLISKLYSYGVSEQACKIIMAYLCDRKQRVKILGCTSSVTTINKGVPQGSVLGPLLFNIFLNDLFFMKIKSKIANYADDNHIYNSNPCPESLQNILEIDTYCTMHWLKVNQMDANPTKFQCIGLNRLEEMSLSFCIDENIIKSQNSIKVLGVTLDENLNFGPHISNICKKAAMQINALKRIAKYLDERSRILIYKSFISSNFNYCPVSWIFCGKKNADKLEKLQERALRFVFLDTSSTYLELLRRGGFLSLSQYRLKYLAIEVFKCVRGLNPVYLNSMFSKKKTKYEFRDQEILIQPKYDTTTYGFRSFRYYGSKLWNALPFDVKNTKDLDIFRNNISAWCHSDDCSKLTIF